MLQAYIGASHYHKHNSITTTYGLDHSGEKTYQFNSLGFRGDEFNEHAKKKLFVCGCSHTFGTGLNWEETWAFQFNQFYKADCLMNFATSAGSNQYTTRTLINQCDRHKPDLVIAHYTQSDFIEYVSQVGLYQIGRFSLSDHCIQPDAVKRFAHNFFSDSYCDKRALFESLTQIVALSDYCKARAIPLLILWTEWYKIQKALNNPAIKSLYDRVKIAPFSIYDYKLDYAADGIHAGAKSNKALASDLWSYVNNPKNK